MFPRSPPKISLRHDWTKELGSKVDRQPEGEVTRQSEVEVTRQAKFFHSTQRIPNPIRDRLGQPGITQDVVGVQDERKTSRFQEISVSTFNEELCSSDSSGRSDITQDVISVQACSSEDSKSLNVEQTHERSGRPGKDTVAVQDDPEVYHESETLNINDETIRERIETDMNFKISGLSHSIKKYAQSASVRELIQKIENLPNRHTLQRDLRQNQSFNPFSPESKQMIHELGNIELCELLETESKTQCKVCLSYWDIDIIYCTCGHFLRKGREENQKFIKYTMDLLSIPDDVIKRGRPHGHRYDKKPGDKEYYIVNQLKKKCKKKCFQDIHDRFKRDEQFRSRMIEIGRNEDLCRQMDALADEDHTHHVIPQEYFYYKSIGGFVRTRQVPILCQCSADLTSSKYCLPCSNWKRKKKKLHKINDGQRILLLLHEGVDKILGGLLISYESHHGDEPSTDWTRRLVIQVFGSILQDMIFLSIILLQMDRLQLTSVYYKRRECKYHTSNDVFPLWKKCVR